MTTNRAGSNPFLEPGAAVGFEEARVAILPVPFEGTVSYGRGASRGPAAILAASEQLELLDERSGEEPFRCGVWTDRALEVEGRQANEVVAAVEHRVGELLDAGKWVVMLGGEHSISTGGVRAATDRHPGLHVVQLDAHADLRDRYDGSSWSHACAMRRCLELAQVNAFGIRSYSAEELRVIRAGLPGYRIKPAWEMDGTAWIEPALAELRGKSVYLTVDVDYFDPAVVPATGTPEPGGPGWWTTLRFLEELFRVADVVCADVVELAPVPQLHHADYTVARLVYKLIGLAFPAGRAGSLP